MRKWIVFCLTLDQWEDGHIHMYIFIPMRVGEVSSHKTFVFMVFYRDWSVLCSIMKCRVLLMFITMIEDFQSRGNYNNAQAATTILVRSLARPFLAFDGQQQARQQGCEASTSTLTTG